MELQKDPNKCSTVTKTAWYYHKNRTLRPLEQNKKATSRDWRYGSVNKLSLMQVHEDLSQTLGTHIKIFVVSSWIETGGPLQGTHGEQVNLVEV